MTVNIVTIALFLVIALYFLHDVWQNNIARKVMMLVACFVIVSLAIGYRNKSASLYKCNRDVASLIYDIDHFND